MDELPKGCSWSFRVSFIEDPMLRPHPDSKWFYEIKTKEVQITGVASSYLRAVSEGNKEVKRLPKEGLSS